MLSLLKFLYQKARVEWEEGFSKVKHVQYSDGTKQTIFPTGKVITENPDGTGDIN